tara:strand:- start:5232 stop:5897 length:666 start_codon:yes stop_codon:yes gene_type:complete
MKFTQEQVINIIKEEIAAVLGEEANDQTGPSLPIIPIAIMKLFLADAASPNALTYFEPDNRTFLDKPDKNPAAAPRAVPPENEKALDIFDPRFIPNEVIETIGYAIEQSGVDEKTRDLLSDIQDFISIASGGSATVSIDADAAKSYMEGLFTQSDPIIPGTLNLASGPYYFRMPEIIKLAQVLLESLNNIEIPNAQDLDFTMHLIREINPKLADKIEKELS